MNKLKFCITFLSAVLMVPAQVAWASFDSGRKSAYNRFIKENFKGTYNDLYRNHGMMFDEDSRGIMEMWLRQNGNTPVAAPQAMIIRDKSGKDTLKLLFNQAGRTLTLTFTEGNYENFDVNGKKIKFGDVRSASTVLSQLAENDGTLAPIERMLKTTVIQVPRKSDVLSVGQFAKLSRIQKVQYLMLLRQNIEAAQAVHDEAANAVKTAQTEQGTSSSLVFHPFFLSQMAWAAPAPIVKENDKCIVAGNVSVYEKNGGHLACAPFPTKNPQGFQPQPTFHDRCTGTGKGRMVACNPLLYGTDNGGAPYCVDSGDQPSFTKRATETCNKLSPLTKIDTKFENLDENDKKSRLAEYEKILKSYFVLKGNNADKLKDCFAEDHKIAPSCRSLFEGQYNDFIQFKNDAEKICATVKVHDQPHACEELKKRALDLITFLETVEVPGYPPVGTVDLIKDGCLKVPGARWDEQANDCFCPNNKRANSLGGNQFECPKESNPPTPPIAPITDKKDECKKEDGSESKSFKCNPALWLIPIIGVGILAWLMGGKDKDKDKVNPTPTTTPPGGTMIPPTVTVVLPPGPTVPTTTQSPPTTQAPPTPVNEGSNGQAPGSKGGGAGGVR